MNIIASGHCEGLYKNAKLEKPFSEEVVVIGRWESGSMVIHRRNRDVSPLCYIKGGAHIAVEVDDRKGSLGIRATTDDGQSITMELTDFTLQTF